MQILKEFSNKLYDHIDAPIRKAVAGMNLLGFRTHFSCCGFDYEGQPSFKSHLKPYIFLDSKDIWENPILKVKLYDICLQAGWTYRLVEHIYLDFYADIFRDPNDPWANRNSIHFYEKSVIAIEKLNKTLGFYQNHFVDSSLIIDGNLKHKEQLPYWQYPACEEGWTVTKEEWKNL